MAVSAAALQASTKPNFVVIVADDLGWADVGFNGSSFHQTPNLDRLAKDGVVFDHGYSAGPVCSPTRASLLTGQTTARTRFTAIHYPRHHGRPLGPGNPEDWPAFLRLIEPNTVTAIPENWTTLPEVLREHGYATGMFGKWHLGPFQHSSGEPNSNPENHGFDLAQGWGSAGSSYRPPWNVANLKHKSGDEYLTDALTDAAIAFMEKNRDRPFFVYLPHFAVHSPWMAVAEDIAHFEKTSDPNQPQHNAVYAAMLKRLDDSVGRIRDALKDLGVADHTVIIFTSDNGCVPEDYRGENDPDRRLDGFKPGQKITSAAPLRGEKGTLFEGGIRVPTIFYLPGTKANGSRTDAPMITYDLFPTILALADIQPPPGWPLDGISLRPALDGKPLPDRPLIWHYPHYVSSPPSDKYPDGMKQRPSAAIRMGPWKLIHEFENGNSNLFNIAADPGEEKDLASWRPDTVARLRSRLLDYLNSVEAQIPQRNPKYRQATPSPAS